jgi:hypothetical protein
MPSSPLGLDPAFVLGDPGCDLSPGVDAQLVEDVLNVGLYRAVTDEQPRADVTVAESLSDRIRHLSLSPGQHMTLRLALCDFGLRSLLTLTAGKPHHLVGTKLAAASPCRVCPLRAQCPSRLVDGLFDQALEHDYRARAYRRPQAGGRGR